MSLDAVLGRIDADLQTSIDRLMEFLRIPSISTDPAYDIQVDQAADWLVADLQSIGIAAEKRTTTGHPMVVGHVGEDSDAPPCPVLRPLRRATGRSAGAVEPRSV